MRVSPETAGRIRAVTIKGLINCKVLRMPVVNECVLVSAATPLSVNLPLEEPQVTLPHGV